MHICFLADESIQEVTCEIQDDADGLDIAADCNHRVWPGAIPGGQVDPVIGQDISNPAGIEACKPVTRRLQAPAGGSIH